jgi:hypothetical protein
MGADHGFAPIRRRHRMVLADRHDPSGCLRDSLPVEVEQIR